MFISQKTLLIQAHACKIKDRRQSTQSCGAKSGTRMRYESESNNMVLFE